MEAGQKRSRFGGDVRARPAVPAAETPVPAPATAGGTSVSEVLARAAATAAALASRLNSNNGTTPQSALPPLSTVSGGGVNFGASGTSSLFEANRQKRAAHYAPALILDSQGRQVDASGKVIEIVREKEPKPVAAAVIRPPASLGADLKSAVAVSQNAVTATQAQSLSSGSHALAQTKSKAGINPYLAHKHVAADEAAGDGVSRPSAVFDPRVVTTSRSMRGRKSLKFVEEGTFVKQGDEARHRAEKQAEYMQFREKGSRLRPVFHAEFDDVAPSASTAVKQEPAITAPVSASQNETAVVPAVAVSASALAASGAKAGASNAAKRNRKPCLAAILATVPAEPASRNDDDVDTDVSATDLQPGMEWWDAAFLPKDRRKEYETLSTAARQKNVRGQAEERLALFKKATTAATDPETRPSFSYEELSITNTRTWNLIQHPVPVLGNAEIAEASSGAQALPLMLTKKERKRVRRQQRAQRYNELIDQIKLGLLPAPEPKVRIANMMRVLKDAAVADPSAVEAKVREQMAARQKNHEMRNLAKKLTPEERREKWKVKMTAHGTAGPEAALFRVSELSNKQIRFKVDVNARETHLCGLALLTKSGEANLVLVEGGTRAVRKYVKLMTDRIDWNKTTADDDDDAQSSDDDEDGPANGAASGGGQHGAGGVTVKGVGSGPGSKCEMVWRGTVPKAHFTEFRFEEVRNAAAARKYLDSKQLVYMWDLVHQSALKADPEHQRKFDDDGDVTFDLTK
jgi:hypothetical protein